MSIEQIIARQAQQARERVKLEAFHKIEGINSLDITLTREIISEAISSSIKEILEGVKQREQEMLDKTIEVQNEQGTEVGRLAVENSILAKRDTINYLEEIIKKLT